MCVASGSPVHGTVRVHTLHDTVLKCISGPATSASAPASALLHGLSGQMFSSFQLRGEEVAAELELSCTILSRRVT